MAAEKDFNRNDVYSCCCFGFRCVFSKSLKEGQSECIRRMVCQKEDIIFALPTGFGNSVIYSPEHYRKKMHRSTSTDSKTFVVVVSPLEYIQKQQGQKGRE